MCTRHVEYSHSKNLISLASRPRSWTPRIGLPTVGTTGWTEAGTVATGEWFPSPGAMCSPEVALWADDAWVDPTIIGGPATAFFLAPDWVLQAIRTVWNKSEWVKWEMGEDWRHTNAYLIGCQVLSHVQPQWKSCSSICEPVNCLVDKELSCHCSGSIGEQDDGQSIAGLKMEGTSWSKLNFLENMLTVMWPWCCCLLRSAKVDPSPHIIKISY